jgi:transposase
MDKIAVCGLEVSARELVVAMEGKTVQRVANTAAGHRRLLATLTRGGKRVRVVMEATGMYGMDAALVLSGSEGVQVMVANPRSVRDFAKAMMQRSKSDPLDAQVLREYGARMPFRAWQRPSKNRLALWAITRRIEALSAQSRAEKNRRHAAEISQVTPACVRRDIARNLRQFEQSLRRLRQEAQKCLAEEAELRRQFQLLLSTPGIACSSALQILGELAVLPADRDIRQWVAYAGLDPTEYRSGESVRRQSRLSRDGNRHLRSALYMPALVAIRWEPHLRGFYEHLVQRGKRKKQALLAVARKLLHAIYGMFRNNAPYQGQRVFQLRPLPAPPAQIYA